MNSIIDAIFFMGIFDIAFVAVCAILIVLEIGKLRKSVLSGPATKKEN